MRLERPSEELSRSLRSFAEQPVQVRVFPMQAALSRLPLADLMSLMQYIVTSTQAGYASGAYPAPAHTLQSEGDSTYDGLVSRANPCGTSHVMDKGDQIFWGFVDIRAGRS